MTDIKKDNIENSVSSLNPFDFEELTQFINNNNLMSIAAGFVIARSLEDITNKFFDNLVVPIVKKDSDKDGINDLEDFFNKPLQIYGRSFYFGKVLYQIIKFLVILYTLFLLIRLFKYFT
jgi:large-conductance mechanosensitive channel